MKKLCLMLMALIGAMTLPAEAGTPSVVNDGFHFIPIPKKGYRLVWHDEFDGTELNPDWWTYEMKRAGWVNNELQTYVNDSPAAIAADTVGSIARRLKLPSVPEGVRVTEVADGVLTVTASKHGDDIYSGRLYAMVDSGWQYGIFEARMKLPKGRGAWPAFWMKPVHPTGGWPRFGEIDIMEAVGYRPDYTQSGVHTGFYNAKNHNQQARERNTPGTEDDFHVYALEWTPDEIISYVDGEKLFTFRNDGKGDDMTWPFDKPFYMILNLAWGGSWGGMKGVDETALPAKMEVDYVRVFQKKSQE